MSMADSTACSASSEYGGWRSRKGSRLSDGGGAIEYSADELDIVPGGALPRGAPERCCRVIGDDQLDTMEPVYLTPEVPNSQLRLEKSLSSERAESKDCFWPNQFKLPEEVRTARRHLVRHRIAVPGRAMLQDVADVDV